MAHPTQLLAEFETLMPGMKICSWIYGQFTAACLNGENQKGLLIASERQLFFFPKVREEGSSLLSVAFADIEAISTGIAGNVNLVCHLKDGGYVKIAYVSRGSQEEFLAYLKVKCFNLKGSPQS